MENNQDFVIENCVLKKYTGPGGDVVIPESVKEIGDSAFSDCTGLTSVTISESVKKIGDHAFAGCTGLTEILVDANNSVYHSEDGMLFGKECLLVCPAGRTGNATAPEGVTKIGDWAFDRCTGLTSVTISDGVTEIGKGAFRGCTGLTSVTIPACVKKIGDGTFSGCEALTSITIPESVTEIGWYAFHGCTGLTSVTIPEGVKNINKSVFEGCRPVLVAPHIPVSGFDAADKPGACASFAKRYLEKAKLDEEIKAGYLKYIKGQKKKLYPIAIQHEELLQLMITEKMLDRKDIDPLLAECDRQNNVTAKAAVLEYAGRNLKPVDPLAEMEKELKRMERQMEKTPEQLEAERLSKLAKQQEREAKKREEFLATGVMTVGEAKKIFLYKKIEESGLTITRYKGTDTNLVIPKAIGKEPVTGIGSWAFSGRTGLTSVTIPEGVTKIGGFAFYCCTGLTSVTIPEGVTEIGNCAFWHCIGLTSVTIPESVKKIEGCAFEGCTSLTIHAPAGSAAEQYAKENGIKFAAL